jgi:hypothetical protein
VTIADCCRVRWPAGCATSMSVLWCALGVLFSRRGAVGGWLWWRRHRFVSLLFVSLLSVAIIGCGSAQDTGS